MTIDAQYRLSERAPAKGYSEIAVQSERVEERTEL